MVLMFLLTWSTDSVLGPDTEHKWNAVKYDKLIVILLAGWYSGLCQSLQRHLRLLGIRLPAGPHLSDTSLLLGCYQSQLPREQLRLEWVLVRPGPARPSPARLEEQTTLLVFFMLFRFQTGHVQRSGTYGRECVWEVYCTCEEVYVGGASCCVRLICFRLAEQSWRVSISPPTRPQGLKSCPGVCQNTESRTWEKLWFFFSFSFFLMNAKISWFKNGSWANWLDLVFLEQCLCCFFSWYPLDFFCYWADQNETASYEQFARCTTIICNCTCCFAASLTPVTESCASILYCNIYLACVYWHSIAIWF